MNTSLPGLGLLVLTLRQVHENWRVWLAILWLPTGLLVGVDLMLAAVSHGAEGAVWALLLRVLGLGIFVGLVSVQWHRWVILSEAPVSILVTMQGTLWCYVWRWILFWAVALVPGAAGLGLWEHWSDAGGAPGSGGPAWLRLLGLALAAVLVLRFALTLPSIAVRYEKIRLRDSLRRTRSLALDIIVLALVLALVLGGLVAGLVAVAQWFTLPAAGGLVQILVPLLVFVVIEATALTEIYRTVGPVSAAVMTQRR